MLANDINFDVLIRSSKNTSELLNWCTAQLGIPFTMDGGRADIWGQLMQSFPCEGSKMKLKRTLFSSFYS